MTRACRRWMMLRLATLCALVIAMLLHGGEAEACNFPQSEVSRVVGFEEDGRFVEYRRYEDGASEDLHEESFTLYDVNGVELSRLALVWDEKRDRTLWQAKGSPYFGNVARGLDGDDTARLEKAIVKAKKLTMPIVHRKLRHVKSETACGSVELDTEEGWLRVAEVDLLSSMPDAGCEKFKLDAFEHPKVSFLFVRVRNRVGYGESLRDTDLIAHLPKRRVEGIASALRGERARVKGRLDEAISALEASIKAAPEYLPSRLSLIRAYAKAGRKVAPLLARLRHPIPEHQSFIGSPPDPALIAKLFEAWPGAKVPETFPWSDGRTEARGIVATFD